MRLFHVSEDGGLDLLIPRIPLSRSPDEDEFTDRVCFSTSISGCLRAINTLIGHDYYVYELIGDHPVYKPKEDEVFDVRITKEKWIKEPCRVKLLYKIKTYDKTLIRVYYNPYEEKNINYFEYKYYKLKA